MDINKKLADQLKVKLWQVEAAVKLIDEGNTIPFIARYRKEATGTLSDEQLRDLSESLNYLRNLEDRKATIISSITEQEAMTEELMAAIEAAETMVALEDIYRPYRPKRRTRATIAKEKGLTELADYILSQDAIEPIEIKAGDFVNEEKGVNSVEDAIDGACDIIAEMISDEAKYRTAIRERIMDEGIITSEAKDDKAESVYEMYYHFQESIKKLAGHRILALNRGEEEKILTVKVVFEDEWAVNYLASQTINKDNKFTTPLLKRAAEDAYSRLIFPSIEREVRNALTEKAEDGAIDVFKKNLVQILMQPPIAGQVVLGWDPAFRTGCKLAVVDETGKVMDTKVIYPTAPQNKVAEAKSELKKLVKKYNVTLISCGNGTASRESEAIIADFIKEMAAEKGPKLNYVIVNEAGASVYSASKLATEEFPNFDVGQRSAASIARRLQDPLAELVKIDPKSIGVGQYQHDMDQKKLSEALGGVVEDCVNRVGVDLNTASAPLLSHISGINKTLAKNIVDYREANGRFTLRKQLLKVPKLGPKAYEQCAGFMRITGGEEPLDATSVHPESYEAAKGLMNILNIDPDNTAMALTLYNNVKDKAGLAKELGVGEPTLKDIVNELVKPGRDPREDMPSPILRSDVLDMEDLKPGMILKGTVRNVIDFGAFVDIGVHQDGLVHISQMCDRFIKHPLEVVSVGDVVEVKVMEVDVKKKRIALTMKTS